MKVIFIIFLLLVSIRAIAPPYPTLYITIAEPIDPYKAIKYAIGCVECKLDTLALNPSEQAYGYFQVRQVRLDDYYKRTGIKYSLSDMYDYEKAERVFMYYATRIGHRNPGRIAREWNGSGPKTWDYWNKVKIYLII
jgi:hypothetical protein